jgi:hypothetical protein
MISSFMEMSNVRSIYFYDKGHQYVDFMTDKLSIKTIWLVRFMFFQ